MFVPLQVAVKGFPKERSVTSLFTSGSARTSSFLLQKPVFLGYFYIIYYRLFF